MVESLRSNSYKTFYFQKILDTATIGRIGSGLSIRALRRFKDKSRLRSWGHEVSNGIFSTRDLQLVEIVCP